MSDFVEAGAPFLEQWDIEVDFLSFNGNSFFVNSKVRKLLDMNSLGKDRFTDYLDSGHFTPSYRNIAGCFKTLIDASKF